mmetsp:Transcript_170361/g.541099  ORF Transcript_170361/g.541099 Transcript_170361/m.541099 type:complete len:204 (+) Transcript_170361:113-724(+)
MSRHATSATSFCAMHRCAAATTAGCSFGAAENSRRAAAASGSELEVNQPRSFFSNSRTPSPSTSCRSSTSAIWLTTSAVGAVACITASKPAGARGPAPPKPPPPPNSTTPLPSRRMASNAENSGVRGGSGSKLAVSLAGSVLLEDSELFLAAPTMVGSKAAALIKSASPKGKSLDFAPSQQHLPTAPLASAAAVRKAATTSTV